MSDTNTNGTLSLGLFEKRLKKREASLRQAEDRIKNLEDEARKLQVEAQAAHEASVSEDKEIIAACQRRIQADGNRRQVELQKAQAPLILELQELGSRKMKLQGQVEDLQDLLGLDGADESEEEPDEAPNEDLHGKDEQPYPTGESEAELQPEVEEPF